MANVYEVELPNGGIIEIEGDRPPTRAEADKAIALSRTRQSSPGEMQRREGAGEIAALAPETVAQSNQKSFLDIFANTAPVNLTPTGYTVPIPRTQEEAKGFSQAYKEVAPFAAGMAAPELLPAKLLAGPGAGLLTQLARVGLESLVGSTAAQVTSEVPDVIQGKGVGQAVAESVLPIGAGTAAGPLLYGALRGAAALTKGIRGGVAEILRNVELTPEQLRGLKARRIVRTITGEEVPVGIAEATDLRPSLQRLLDKGNEVTPEDLKPIQDLVLQITANAARSGRTKEAISKQVFDVLAPQRQAISDTVKKSVDDFTRQAISSVNNAEGMISGEASKLFPPGRSPAQIGGNMAEEAIGSLESSKQAWDDAYDAVRSNPDYKNVRVDLNPVVQQAKSAGIQLVKDADGNISPFVGAPTRGAVGSGEALGTTATLDEARNLASEISKTIRNPGVLPGIDVRIKAQLADATRAAINGAVQPFPQLAQDLAAANKIYAENIGRFRGAFVEGVLKDVGEEGGMVPEGIVRALTGANAETNLETFLSLLGKGATAGTSREARGLELVREAFMSKAASAGRKGEGINAGKMFSTINDIPEPVRNQLFPNFGQIKDLMVKEAALGRTGPALKNPESFLETLDLNPADLQEAFSTGDLASLKTFAQNAVATQKSANERLASLGLNELANRDTFDIYKFVTDPSNSTKTRNLVTRLQTSHPEELRDVRALFVEDLMHRAEDAKGDFSPAKFKELIQEPQALAVSPATEGPTTGGRTSGTHFEVADSLLGPKERRALSDMADTLADIKTVKDVELETGKTLFNRLMFGWSGGNAMQGTPNSFWNLVGRALSEVKDIRYSIAAHYLTDQNLRRKVLEPIGNESFRDFNRALRLATQTIRLKFGKDSEMYKQIRSVDDNIPGP